LRVKSVKRKHKLIFEHQRLHYYKTSDEKEYLEGSTILYTTPVGDVALGISVDMK